MLSLIAACGGSDGGGGATSVPAPVLSNLVPNTASFPTGITYDSADDVIIIPENVTGGTEDLVLGQVTASVPDGVAVTYAIRGYDGYHAYWWRWQ